MIINKSNNLFERAKKVIPGGVNSPARAFKSVGGKPIFFESAFGSNLTDVDGCLLYTSDAADERSSVDLGGRRIIKKKKN